MARQKPPSFLFNSTKSSCWLALILLLAFVLRLAYALPQNPVVPYDQAGGDTGWYLDHGLKLWQGTVTGPPPSAPLYLLFAGLWQTLLPGAGAVIVMRLSQVVMGTTTVYFAYRLARVLSGDERAGLLAAGALAVAPVFIIETALILTETLYIFLVIGALTAYVEMTAAANQASISPTAALLPPPDHVGTRHASSEGSGGEVRLPRIILVALTLGLATMTRAVLLLFPLGLALHLLLVYGWRRGLKSAAVLLTVYALVTSIWTIYNLVRWDIPVIGAQGLSAFLLIGATEWQPPDQMDRTLAQGNAGQLPTNPGEQQSVYANAAAQAIGDDPLGWIARRFTRLAGAYLQPHGTTFFPGESLKDLTARWLGTDRTPGGLLRLSQGDQFWPKLAIYLFHYTSLLAGVVGLWLTRRNWRVALPLAGFILYTTLIHLLLDALPRYLFPLSVIWWVFAGVALVAAWDRLRHSNRLRLSPAQEQGAS